MNNTIVDWCSGLDFAMMPDSYPGGPAGDAKQFSFPMNTTTFASKVRWAGAGGVAPDWNVAYVAGVAKNDPRVRSFATYVPPTNAWYRVGFDDWSIAPVPPAWTYQAQNSVVNFTSGTGIPGIPNDEPDSGSPALVNASTFYIKATNVATNYESA